MLVGELGVAEGKYESGAQEKPGARGITYNFGGEYPVPGRQIGGEGDYKDSGYRGGQKEEERTRWVNASGKRNKEIAAVNYTLTGKKKGP